jgi:hypothetical protein
MLDTSQLTDSELTFLLSSVENVNIAEDAEEHHYKFEFVRDAEVIVNILDAEYRRRKLNWEQVVSDPKRKRRRYIR